MDYYLQQDKWNNSKYYFYNSIHGSLLTKYLENKDISLQQR